MRAVDILSSGLGEYHMTFSVGAPKGTWGEVNCVAWRDNEAGMNFWRILANKWGNQVSDLITEDPRTTYGRMSDFVISDDSRLDVVRMCGEAATNGAE